MKDKPDWIPAKGPSEPVDVRRTKYSRLFGLVRIEHLVEDRRPDLTAEEYPDKYKHYIWVKIGWWGKFSWVFRQEYPLDEQPFVN